MPTQTTNAWAVLLLSLPTLTMSVGEVCACTIPVFRYALDRWEADRFSLVLSEADAQSTTVSDLLRPLRASGHANLAITTEPGLGLTELRTARLGGQTLWSGALDQGALDAILDSPARRQILRQILAGDSVIWVLATDDSEAEQAAADRVEKRLRFLEQVATLPLQDPNDPDSRLGPGPPLLLKFSTLRLRRDDPAEQLLLHMLAGPSPTFAPGGTGFAAAVFGRGRVLASWALATLDDQAIEDACLFLIGRCSCRVKDQNPGWDILMNVDWQQALQKTSQTAAKTAAELPVQIAATSAHTEPVSVVTTPSALSTPPLTSPPAQSGRFGLSWLEIGAATFVLTLVVGLVFLGRKA